MRTLLLPILIGLAACSYQAPDCTQPATPVIAPSAGCFVMSDNKVLVVETLQGLVNLPGGSSQPNEPAQCTAQRETWEETGLHLRVGELLTVVEETGFHLYHCHITTESGEIDPPPRMEVRAAYWLKPDRFGEKQWRFKGDETRLADLASSLETQGIAQ